MKVADHLGLEHGVESFNGLYLDHGRFCDDEVQSIVANDMAFVLDRMRTWRSNVTRWSSISMASASSYVRSRRPGPSARCTRSHT
jgi:hypothetical protein